MRKVAPQLAPQYSPDLRTFGVSDAVGIAPWGVGIKNCENEHGVGGGDIDSGNTGNFTSLSVSPYFGRFCASWKGLLVVVEKAS